MTSLKVSSPKACPEAHEVKGSATSYAVRLQINDQRDGVSITAVMVHFGENHVEIGVRGQTDPFLAAIQNPALTIAGGHGRDGPDVRPGVRFGDSEGSVKFTAEQRFEIQLSDIGLGVPLE